MKILSCLPIAAALSLMTLTPGIASVSPEIHPAAATAHPGAKPVEIARRGRGADDGPNHDKNDDHGRRGGKGRGRGADDGKGDDHGGKRHSATETAPAHIQLARRGADDRKGDDRGGKGRGRGRDDGRRHG